MKPTCVFTFLLLLVGVTNGYNILVTVMGISGSQNLIMYRLAEILGKRGHDVTILKKEVFPEAKTPKLEYSKEISYKVIKNLEELDELHSMMNTATWTSVTEGSGGVMAGVKVFMNMKKVFQTISKDCDKLLHDEQMLSTIKSKKFDVIIMHIVDFCSYGMAHALGINGTVIMSTAFMVDFLAWYSGSPSLPSYVVSGPNIVQDRMTFVERMKNTIMSAFMFGAFQYGFELTYTEVFQKRYGPEFPSLGELMYKTQLYYINSDPLFEYPRPVPHNVIYVGGLTMKTAEPLTEEWEKIVTDAGDAGVIVFSLGSIVNTSFMPTDMKRAFIKAFSRIPQKVIWRLEGDKSEVQNVPNIHVADWLPQKDLIAHPKVKALLTHGGYNSLTEATYMGVPLVMFPLFGDQYANCKRVERLKVGVILTPDNIDEEKILTALNSVLNSEEVQSNARRLGRMIRGKPDSSHDLAVKWVEFLAEFKNLDQLKPASLELNLVEYFLVDVLLTLLLGCVIFIFVCFKCCTFCVKRTVCRKGKRKTE